MLYFVNAFRLLTIFIVPGISSLLNLEELANIQYAIDILDKPLLLNENEDNDGVVLSSRYGQLYQCQYEAVASGDGAGQEGDENVAKAEVVDLLKPMEDEPCLVQSTGWWTYELCYKKEMKQYHLEEGKISGNIISLGRYASEFNWNDVSLKSRPEYAGRYHSQEYTNGSLCDLTGELRSVSVRFKCQPDAHDGIDSVEEPTTCTYVVTVRTNKICQRPELKVLSQKKSVPITCQPLLSEEEYSHYTEFHTQNAVKRVAESLPVPDRETTDRQPGTSLSRAESFFIMAETADDSVNVGDSSDEMKRVLVGAIVKKLRKKLNTGERKEEEEEEDDDEKIEEKDKRLNTEPEKGTNQQPLPNEKKDGEESEVVNAEAQKVSSESAEQTTDAASELKSALEGILTAVDSELKTFANDDDEEEDDKEEEDDVVVAQKIDAKQDSLVQEESGKKEEDVSGGSSATEVTDRKKVDGTSSGEELTDTEVEGSYITWQGQGNQIQQITIDTGMKVRVKQVKKEDREKEEEEEKSDATDSDPNELMKRKSTAPPSRKVEVRIINAAYYNKDGRPVSVYADDTNPSIERMVIALLQRNDEEVSEFEKQKRIEENYQFKWSKTKEKKETKTTNGNDD